MTFLSIKAMSRRSLELVSVTNWLQILVIDDSHPRSCTHVQRANTGQHGQYNQSPKKGGHSLVNREHEACLPLLRGSSWVDYCITNEEVIRITQHSTRNSLYWKLILRRQLKWLGHVIRRNPDELSKIAMLGLVEGNRTRGRPQDTWLELLLKEASL